MQKHVARLIVIILMMTLCLTASGTAQGDGSYTWIKVFGDSGATAYMVFGNHVGNTRGMDSADSLGGFREVSPELPPPGLFTVWRAITFNQFGNGILGLEMRDFRAFDSETRVDTFKLSFVQTDNGSATISFAWADSASLKEVADSVLLTVSDPRGNYTINMMAVDTLAIPTAGDSGIFIARIIKYGAHPCSSCSPLATDNDQPSVPTRNLLLQNYPNPFNPATEIRFEVPVSGFVSLKVFDVLGRELATLVHEQKSPGTYTVKWDPSTIRQAHGSGRVPSGVYYYRLATPSFVEVRKMMLIK